MADDSIECVVIGAGVVGLAIARRLSQSGREVVIIEREEIFGEGVSSRNSEVIHAGMYYAPQSLKAKACVSGKQQLYDYCRAHNIGHKNCGKLIVATCTDEELILADIATRAQANNIDDLVYLSAQEAKAMEPQLSCTSALWSPSTGIIDSHNLMFQLLADAENAGAICVYSTPFISAKVSENGFEIATGGAQPTSLHCRVLINAAGLHASACAAAIIGLDPCHIPPAFYAKGSYFTLSGPAPFSHLIYPVPVEGGLGVHVTLDLAGQVKFGPDIEWLAAPNYNVNPERAAVFYDAVRRYWPDLPDGALLPGYAGVRPKIIPPGVANSDFLISGPHTHKIPGLVNLFGIESPGLTACLALADYVLEHLN